MRLIDTDEMNEKLFYRELGGKDVLITAKSVFDMIKALPTAYDAEKVVEELNEESSMFHSMFGYSVCSIRLGKAKDIVRKGGVE